MPIHHNPDHYVVAVVSVNCEDGAETLEYMRSSLKALYHSPA
jgi:hypothetical protein